MNTLLIFLGKLVMYISRVIGKGSGSTWPGHIALSQNPFFISEITQKNPNLKIILIAGTNGKTTTSRMIATILEENGKTVLQNKSGANLLNGVASSFIESATILGKVTKDFAVFEIDENTLPLVLEQTKPAVVIVLNLFRDQLDRYGELDSIAKKWKNSFSMLPNNTTVVLNADDPQVAFLGEKLHAKTVYFGLEEKGETASHLQHASDSIYCPNCHNRLEYKKIYYSHLGVWNCTFCKLKRPQIENTKTMYPLPGAYNKYNTLAAVLTSKELGIPQNLIQKAVATVTPAFGRQEKIIVNGKTVQIFLAKNPASFNQTIKTIAEMNAKYMLIVLNDRIPDGRDVSWIWDIDIEKYLPQFSSIFLSGDRVYDIELRVWYAGRTKNVYSFENLPDGIWNALENLPERETLYILPTYSAMLEVRKIITGKKIL